MSAVLDWADGVRAYVFHYEEMEQQIQDLERQVAELEEQAREGQEASRENEQLRELLDLQAKRREMCIRDSRLSFAYLSRWEGEEDALSALAEHLIQTGGLLLSLIHILGLRRLHGVDALPGPGKALLAHLGEEGAPPRPVLPLRLLDAPSDQHQDHLAGQGQVVIQGEHCLLYTSRCV